MCDYIFQKGKKAGSKCVIKPKSPNSLCWRHIKMAETPAPIDLNDDPIFGSGSTITKDVVAPKKINYSIWNITINSNRDYTKMSDIDKERFKSFADYLFTPDTFRRYITDSKPGDNIIEINVEKYFEVGESVKRLHLHGQLSTKHRGHLRLEANKIRAVAEKILGYKIHLDSVVTSDHVRAYAEYMKKKSTNNEIDI